MRSRRLYRGLAAAWAALWLGGCASVPSSDSPGGAAGSPPGPARVLVVPLDAPRPGADEKAARMLASALISQQCTAVLYDRQWRRRHAAGDSTAVEQLAAEIAERGTVDRPLAAQVASASGAGYLLAVSTFAHDQEWDGTTKITRVGVCAWLVDLATGQLWEGRALEKGKGPFSSYEQVRRAAVERLASSIPLPR